ncbi:MAG TPA: DUF6059 family protein [Streptosporangiaceae bacterium]|nr:DUF6059 family protein [Streptosporangiaceae bacterium]
MHMWPWIRRLMPRWEDLLRALGAAGGCWIMPASYLPQDLPPEPRLPYRPRAVELPPGHPERLAGNQPLSPAEQQLWGALERIEW